MTNSRKSLKPTKRCKECGAKCTKLEENGICFGCAMTADFKQKGNVETKKESWSHADHPAILKPKK